MPQRGGTPAAVLIALLSATLPLEADNVDRYVEAEMHRGHIPGVALAVVRNGRIVKEQGYGVADVELNVPMTKDRVFEIGSMTKSFTAAAIMTLVEDGLVRLDDPISTHLTNVPAAWNRITVRHLLTHTSGIGGDARRVAAPGSMDNVAIDNRFYQVALRFQPGEAWAYSNAGYHLLGAIVAKASGESCAAFTARRILNPLGMTKGRVSVANGIVANRAAGYEWKDGNLENRAFMATVGSMGDVGIQSTVGDLAKWDGGLYSDALLKRSSRDQMWTPNLLDDGARPAFDYGYGWFVDVYRGHRVIHHGGETPGFSSSMARLVDDKLTVIVLTNSAGQVVDQFALAIAALYLPALALPQGDIPDPDPQTSRALRQTLVGLIAGTPDLTVFTPSMQRFLNSKNELSEWLASFGPLKSFAFVDAEPSGRDRIRRYRIVMGDTALTFSFTLSDEGKIAHAFFW